MSGFGDGSQRFVVPAGQASRDTGDSHPTVVNIELRQAWDGAWYPLISKDGGQVLLVITVPPLSIVGKKLQ